ncbi:MAG: YibE/F family protein [Desulfobacteraceae bacterium]|nr:YibE/F family protein [Desulfobacteraceae bacterium]
MKKILSSLIVIALIGIVFAFFFRANLTGGDSSGVAELRGVVTGINNDGITDMGLVRIGFQKVSVMLMEGPFKGRVVQAENQLLGQPDTDETYKAGDEILVGVDMGDGAPGAARTLNNYRQRWELILFGVFVGILLLYARLTGVKALFSFIAAFYILWQFFIPSLLAKADPIPVTILTLTLLTVVIIYSVAGISRIAFAATVSTLTGLAITLALTLFFGGKMKLAGMTAPFASALIFSGNIGLDIRDIFYASVIIGASGAAMDIAMDVTASIAEVKNKKPDITTPELIQSGLNVGRMVTGTMTTTLLLAYSGGYLTMLMFFVSKNASFSRIFNYKLVGAELFRTLVGSIGLVMVAPIAAVIAAWVFSIESDKIHFRACMGRLRKGKNPFV